MCTSKAEIQKLDTIKILKTLSNGVKSFSDRKHIPNIYCCNGKERYWHVLLNFHLLPTISYFYRGKSPHIILTCTSSSHVKHGCAVAALEMLCVLKY